jgi:methylmalonyl-CoA epimerase
MTVHYRRVHHLGICVANLDATLTGYRTQLDLPADPERLETTEIRGALIRVGPDLLEIFAPRSAEGSLTRFLERRGDGLHHVAYQVDDIAAALTALAERGARLIDRTPRPGLHPGWQIAFIHPASAGGVLTELVQVDEAASDAR